MPKLSAKSIAKPYPLSLRLPAADVALIDRAARLCGRSRTEFVRDAAVSEAELAVFNKATWRAGPEALAAFMRVIDGPPQCVPEIAEVMTRTPPWDHLPKKPQPG